MNRLTPAFIFAALAGTVFGQVGAPVLGYVPDGNSLRQIHGIAASGVVEGGFSVGRNLNLMEVSPSQTFALATDYDTGECLILTPGADGASAGVVHLQGVPAGVSQIVFSPNGTAALLWFSGTGLFQVVAGLPSAPTVRNTDASFLAAEPAALAVSDDGSWAIGAWGQQVYAFGPSGSSTLPVTGAAKALCFFHSSTNVAVITNTQVVVVSDIGGAAVPNVIWTKAPDSTDPQVAVGLAASSDNSHLTVAGNLGGLYTFDLVAGTAAGEDCACTPTGLAGLGGSLFRLTATKTGTLKIYDAATNEVWFVPLAPTAANGGQQ